MADNIPTTTNASVYTDDIGNAFPAHEAHGRGRRKMVT